MSTVTTPRFQVVSPFAPAGDQPTAIAQLAAGIERGDRFQTLLGITGSGKSATIAWTIEAVQRPTLILAPNKSLAAQLAQEMREFFPHNRVEYFVSYYDYYQPEAYIASSDTYIEKDSSINDEIDRLRHSATAALLTRRDTIVVASVSCIYGMGDPDEYRGQLLELHVGVDYDMRSILRRLVDLQFDRNDMTLGRGKFRVRGDTIEIHPSYEETVLRIEMFGDTVDRITMVDPLTGETLSEMSEVMVFPATHYVAGDERMRRAVEGIEVELQERLAWFEANGKLLEAQRLRMRTQYDLEMIQEVGYCNGIENYSMHTPCSTTSPTTFCWSSTKAMWPCPSCTASTWATCAARTSSSSTASACRAPATTVRCASRRCSSASINACSCRPPRPTTRSATARRWSSRSCAPPGWPTRR